ncbi:MAG: MBL fold metallo-hydrolase, partial [Coriobacteriia bacterium]|nr:MBL fold metallo-hydrolase [Coriobacteriia bacterium]
MARLDRVEFDQAIAEWVKGLGECNRRCSLARRLLDRMSSAQQGEADGAAVVRSAKKSFLENLGRECQEVRLFFDKLLKTGLADFSRRVDALLVEPAFCYFDAVLPDAADWPTGLAQFREAAQELVCDDQWRDHKVETRVRLLDESQKLWGHFRWLQCRGEGDRRTELEEHTSELAGYIRGVAAGLLSYGKQGELPEQFKHRLRELEASLSEESLLPIVNSGMRETPDRLHLRLHEFLHDAFLIPDDSKNTGSACRWCGMKLRFSFGRGAYRCVRPDPDPSDAAEAESSPAPCVHNLVSSNDSFPLFGLERGSRGLTHYYDLVRAHNQDEIDTRLQGKRRRHDAVPGWRLAILQRWNSFTPAMAASEGGGYFLYRNGPSTEGIHSGIAIDPGYGFVKNFFAEGFGLRDISSIIVTHDHPDHLADFGAIVNLLVEAKSEDSWDGLRKPKQVTAWLSEGAFAHLEPAIASTPEVF